MFRFFLAEDDASQRSALRRSLLWAAHGFSCIGEAADGELAIPALRSDPPDLLVTDLHMPFLDGLELCRQVRQELPGTKLLLLSGSATQGELQSALALGVDGYLAKPVDPEQLTQILQRIRTQLEREQSLREAQEQQRQRAAAWKQFLRERFFLSLVTGNQQAKALYQDAQAIGLELHARSYTLLRCHVTPGEQGSSLEAVWRELQSYFAQSDSMHSFGWSPSGFFLLVLSDAAQAEREVSFAVQNIQRRLHRLGKHWRWMVAVTESVHRLVSLRESYQTLMEMSALSQRFPDVDLMTPELYQTLRQGNLEERLLSLPPLRPLDAELKLFLEHGSADQAEAFARQCAEAMGKEAMDVPELSLYVLLRLRLAIQSHVIGLGLSVEELQKAVADLPGIETTVGSASVVRYLTALLQCLVRLRSQSGQHSLHPAVQQALLILERSYTDPDLSLASVAQEVGVTPNYFSTLFRQNVGCGFSVYLTDRRMAHARDLLRFTKLSSAQVAAASGYPDARYFSTQFHRTQGCTPREYRSKKKEQH